ncbi:MAG: hypothetical protein IIZ69_00325 [Pseudomonas sp.]|nr:hypothetical protein [Pseudomonas sp.]
MSTLKQRFALLAQAKPEITRADLARATGASAPSVHAWFSGDTKSMKAVTASKAALLYGCNTRWLSDGEGEIWPQRIQPAGTSLFKSGTPALTQTEPREESHEAESATVAQALDVIANCLETLTETGRAEVSPLLQALTLAPDSKRLKDGLVSVLTRRD